MSNASVCQVCGRTMPNTRATTYCSQGCRTHRLSKRDHLLEQTILDLLAQRAQGATICPSEASRAVYGDSVGLTPRAMERTRCAARRLVAAGRLHITQKGRVVSDPSHAKGPIRLRAVPRP